ncbi:MULTISPECIES: N-acyl amino acid synthase FeeM domain-containing protein [Rhizobium]|uniref:N-acyl amino acid synthase FeeM catalytic core domain-containing protein n=1 Tax=Rhizobium rhododendri TaxID=2506430 RepID=A0ABY8IF21_9HYPH|nr:MULTISPECIES: hypothetical protein [Rhizobium]TQX86281.1 hypothetical protein EQW76_19140 [Rhizobium sp. rho-13.1]TQY11632.1 hypothetical protein EQW74_16820 [Rhizobium sp. rho-1.1]WFS21937.1 hypothetical protein PR018_12235 [Rhizobium rhododendri]
MRNEVVQSSFSNKLLEVLDHIEYRRVETQEDMEEVARMRYRAYKLANILTLDGAKLIDAVDFDDHAYVFGVYFDERLISTVRIHHVTPDHRISITRDMYPKEIDAFLDSGMTLIDPVRFAADPEIIGEMPALPYLTLRIASMAADYFDADRVLQLVSPQHAPFYKRVFSADTVVPAQMGVGKYNIPLTLMATRTREVRTALYERFPFFISEPYERRMMFQRSKAMGSTPLTILPTARFAAANRAGTLRQA